MDNFYTRDEAIEMIAAAEDEIKELKKQNKRLIDAVKKLLNSLDQHTKHSCSSTLVDFFNKQTELKKIISEIEGE